MAFIECVGHFGEDRKRTDAQSDMDHVPEQIEIIMRFIYGSESCHTWSDLEWGIYTYRADHNHPEDDKSKYQECESMIDAFLLHRAE